MGKFRNLQKSFRIVLFLSEKSGYIFGEKALETKLKDEHGWTIIPPEQMTVTQQLEALSDAEIISGFAGSALHILVLAKNVQAKVLIVQRENIINPNFHLSPE